VTLKYDHINIQTDLNYLDLLFPPADV